MGKTFEVIDGKLKDFIERQHVFFVATAPLADDGLINLSPKGLTGTFAVLDETTVAYLDMVGSGVETIAHLRQNGRICLMFCAFDGPPRIVRIHGRGDVIEPEDAAFEALKAYFGDYPGTRAVIRIEAHRISDSCGYGVPRLEYAGERDQLQRWAERQGEVGLAKYKADRNALSLDGLPSGLGKQASE